MSTRASNVPRNRASNACPKNGRAMLALLQNPNGRAMLALVRNGRPTIKVGTTCSVSKRGKIVAVERLKQAFLIAIRPRRVGARRDCGLRQFADVPVLTIRHIPELD